MMKKTSLLILMLSLLNCQSKKKSIATIQKTPHWIVGEWKIVKINFDYIEHDYCGKLKVGTIFSFNKSNRLNIYNQSKVSLCEKDQYFTINQKELMTSHYDIVNTYTIEKFNDSILVLKTTQIPAEVIQNSERTNNNLGWVKDSISLKIEKDGIRVELKKNVG